MRPDPAHHLSSGRVIGSSGIQAVSSAIGRSHEGRWPLAGSAPQRRLQLLSVDLVALRMESGRQHSALGVGEYRCGASPMFVTELETEAVELPDHLGPDPKPELERVWVVRQVTPSPARRGSIGSDARQPALSSLVSEGDSDPIKHLERQLSTPCVADEIAQRLWRLQSRQERPTELNPHPAKIGPGPFDRGFVTSVEGEPLVDRLRTQPAQPPSHRRAPCTRVFGTGWPRATNEAPISTVKRESDVTLNCDD